MIEPLELSALTKFSTFFFVEMWDIYQDIKPALEIALGRMSPDEKKNLDSCLRKLYNDKSANFAQVGNGTQGDTRIYGEDNSRAFLFELLDGLSIPR